GQLYLVPLSLRAERLEAATATDHCRLFAKPTSSEGRGWQTAAPEEFLLACFSVTWWLLDGFMSSVYAISFGATSTLEDDGQSGRVMSFAVLHPASHMRAVGWVFKPWLPMCSAMPPSP